MKTLAELTAERDALNVEIEIVTKAIAKAAYDASMRDQYLRMSERREAEGKPAVSFGQWSSGCY